MGGYHPDGVVIIAQWLTMMLFVVGVVVFVGVGCVAVGYVMQQVVPSAIDRVVGVIMEAAAVQLMGNLV